MLRRHRYETLGNPEPPHFFAAAGICYLRSLSELYEAIRDFYIVADGEKLLGTQPSYCLGGSGGNPFGLCSEDAGRAKGSARFWSRPVSTKARGSAEKGFLPSLHRQFFRQIRFRIVDKSELPQGLGGLHECVNSRLRTRLP